MPEKAAHQYENLYEIRIRKEALKFASAHMTVFPDGTKEALHGHHYVPTVTIAVKSVDFKNMVPFSDVKIAMKKIAALWDEKVLLAKKNPHFKITTKKRGSIEFVLCKKLYVLPTDEVILLDVDNITCENLAYSYFEFLKQELDWLDGKNVLQVKVFIEESPGQGASFVYTR
jgi:6-pyruvoyltetrahydropterin/6-carboxytetrahydropterin synthase